MSLQNISNISVFVFCILGLHYFDVEAAHMVQNKAFVPLIVHVTYHLRASMPMQHVIIEDMRKKKKKQNAANL